MRKIIYLLLLFFEISLAQIVTIPDVNFKNKLISLGIDTNSDNEIQETEAQVITNLNVSNSNIADLTGIESFINLNIFNCGNNNLTSLNLNTLTNLSELNASNNQITTLNINGLTNLTYLSLSENLLTSIDFSGFTNLETIICGGCPSLTSINVSGLINLQELICDSCNLNSLNLSGLVNLESLNCNFNQLSTLNLSGLTQLFAIKCAQNQIAVLDFTGLTNLIDISCHNNLLTTLNVSFQTGLTDLACQSNQLQTLFLKNGVNETNLIFNNNPSLNYICVDDSQIDAVQNQLNTLGMTNTVCNSYCSFVPGGNYNTITGSFRYDTNNDSCDANDILIKDIRVDINNGPNLGATFSESSGDYKFYPLVGNFDITPIIENPTFFTISPATVTIPFANNNNNVVVQDFCIAANGVHPDLEIVVAPLNSADINSDAEYIISYKNKGNQTISGDLNFTYQELDLDYISSTLAPDSQSAGLLSWNYTNLSPLENRSIKVIMNVNASVGVELIYSVQINPTIGDELTSDNSFVYKQTVVDSQELNFIECLQGNTVDADLIGEYMHYIINFDNIGATSASNVVVKTEIDPTKFDINTLQLLNSSANTYTRIKGNKAEFIFQNLNIDTGGHGNVLLKIKSKDSLMVNDTVFLDADIFFDYAWPLLTEEEITSFLNKLNFDFDNSIVFYPNPTKNKINIKSLTNNSIKSIALYDIQGRLLQIKHFNETDVIFDLSERLDGVYFMKVTTEKGSKVERIVKN